ncbi:MAG TPA: DUF4167 domain-containing protein [Beijerinckiaceae bacterium]|nr:DUF4167 domain-containing protein [Beijerinckiaceae bacterium]
MRGRNRRGPNPLTRSYESNGPDVKIRGTAAHIAEKYVSLARDAHASGDPVAAESYLQHAEHYLRLIAAAQQQQMQAQQLMQGGRVDEADDGMDGDDEFESSVMDRFTFRAPQIQPPPGYVDPNGEQPRHEFAPRPDQPRMEHGRQDQPREHRGDFRRDRNNGDFRRDRGFDRNQPRPDRPQPEAADDEGGLPAFLTAPVRIPIEAGDGPAPGGFAEAGDNAQSGDEGGRFPVRGRRRRHRRGPREDMASGEGPAGEDAQPAISE